MKGWEGREVPRETSAGHKKPGPVSRFPVELLNVAEAVLRCLPRFENHRLATHFEKLEIRAVGKSAAILAGNDELADTVRVDFPHDSRSVSRFDESILYPLPVTVNPLGTKNPGPENQNPGETTERFCRP